MESATRRDTQTLKHKLRYQEAILQRELLREASLTHWFRKRTRLRTHVKRTK